jgi:hypothetical protein
MVQASLRPLVEEWRSAYAGRFASPNHEVTVRVVTPYRPGLLFARTYDAAKAWEGGCELVRVRNADEEPLRDRYNPTYSELLADLWEEGESVLMLEHDVVPYEDSIADIAYCPEPWCGYAYVDGGGFRKDASNLGCTKLSAELIAATVEFGAAERGERDWRNCDSRMSRCAYVQKLRPHRHYPNVEHRATRHRKGAKHPLGNVYIDLDTHGDPIGEPREPYPPRQPSPQAEHGMPSYGDEGEDRWSREIRWAAASAPGVDLGAYERLAALGDELSHMSRPFDPARNEYDDNAYHLMKRMDATRGAAVAANPYAEPLQAKNLKLNQAIAKALGRPRRP